MPHRNLPSRSSQSDEQWYCSVQHCVIGSLNCSSFWQWKAKGDCFAIGKAQRRERWQDALSSLVTASGRSHCYFLMLLAFLPPSPSVLKNRDKSTDCKEKRESQACVYIEGSFALASVAAGGTALPSWVSLSLAYGAWTGLDNGENEPVPSKAGTLK